MSWVSFIELGFTKLHLNHFCLWENAFEIVIYKMAAIFSRPHRVSEHYVQLHHISIPCRKPPWSKIHVNTGCETILCPHNSHRPWCKVPVGVIWFPHKHPDCSVGKIVATLMLMWSTQKSVLCEHSSKYRHGDCQARGPYLRNEIFIALLLK